MIFKTRVGDRSVSLSYHLTGSGSDVFLTFHGYGLPATSMEQLGLPHCRLLHIGLFFHGESRLSSPGEALTTEEWQEIISRLLDHENLGEIGLAGYSMGCRFVLGLMQTMPGRIRKVFLIAPDGFSMAPWYRMAVYPGRRLFQSYIVRPWRFYFLLRNLRKAGLVTSAQVHLASRAMETRSKRKRLFYCWVAFRRFFFSARHMNRSIIAHDIETIIFYGNKDKVIPPERLLPHLKRLTAAKIVPLDSDHARVLSAAAEIISKKNV